MAREVFQLIGPKVQAYEMRDNRYMERIIAYVLKETSNCIDVGAFRGDFVRQFLRFAPAGQHYAFEPIPERAEELKRAFPGVRVRQTALSNSEGRAPFHHVVSNPGYSGLKRRAFDRPREEVEMIEVATERLDDVLPPGFRVDLMKVDVEGGELQVFQGATRTLKESQPYLIFEHGLGGADHYGTTPQMIFELLVEECGLRLFRLDGSRPLSLDEFVSTFRSNTAWNFLAHP
ncbi:MAG: FkbM family methyltransferase [Thermoplasmata archaeon]